MAKQHRKYYDSKGHKLSLVEYLQRGLARADQIIALDRALVPHAEIAELIGVTEERVKQVLREYRKKRRGRHDEKIQHRHSGPEKVG